MECSRPLSSGKALIKRAWSKSCVSKCLKNGAGYLHRKIVYTSVVRPVLCHTIKVNFRKRLLTTVQRQCWLGISGALRSIPYASLDGNAEQHSFGIVPKWTTSFPNEIKLTRWVQRIQIFGYYTSRSTRTLFINGSLFNGRLQGKYTPPNKWGMYNIGGPLLFHVV